MIAEDDQSMCLILSQTLTCQGYFVRITSSVANLCHWIGQGEGDLVIFDVMMLDDNDLDLLQKIVKMRPDLRVIMISAHNSLSTAIEESPRGTFNYLPKPFDVKKLLQTVDLVLKDRLIHSSQTEQIGYFKSADPHQDNLTLIGRSTAMQETYRLLDRLIRTNLTVLINGESGTGKELVAKVLHEHGDRQSGSFIAVNLSTMPKELIESELFGYEKSSFTGAVAKTQGRFELAQGGTLFLDEIGDLPLNVQTRLLKVLQEEEYTSFGGCQPIKVDVRIVAATHYDLKTLIQSGLFREDLYCRLNIVRMCLPSLRDRIDDIPELVTHFLKLSKSKILQTPKIISTAAIELLQQYSWPGNVRELENLIQRIVALYPQQLIDDEVIRRELGDIHLKADQINVSETVLETALAVDTTLPTTEVSMAGVGTNAALSDVISHYLVQYFKAHEGELPSVGLYDRIIKEVEKPLVSLSLHATGNNQIKAAQLLGINRNTLRKKIKELNLDLTKSV